ncbi:hypothetical protein JHK87_015792 [Glycine soja]|nr:hypothetical protein JHK87_015792 [Glycine soja]
MDTIKEELKQEIKLEFSQIASQHSPSLQAHDIQVLAASVSSKGSCAAPKTNAIGKKASDMHGDSVGLHDLEKPVTTPFKIFAEDKALVPIDPLGELVLGLSCFQLFMDECVCCPHPLFGLGLFLLSEEGNLGWLIGYTYSKILDHNLESTAEIFANTENEEFKVRMNALIAKAQKMPEEGWTMQAGTRVFLGHIGGLDTDGNELPRLVYVSQLNKLATINNKFSNLLWDVNDVGS